MRDQTNQKSAMLKEIRREFSSFRRRHRDGRGGGYPQRLKDMALSGLKQGGSSWEVSRAAGVSGESLRLWRRDVKKAGAVPPDRPVELQLVESRGHLEAPRPYGF